MSYADRDSDFTVCEHRTLLPWVALMMVPAILVASTLMSLASMG